MDTSQSHARVRGPYQKEGGGFQPGGASVHNTMSVHGPNAVTRERASDAEFKSPKVGDGSMAFMFERYLVTILGRAPELGFRMQVYCRPGIS